jgi:Retrotransposon gag protein
MFNGLAHEDLNQHLPIFEELCNIVKINGVEPETIKLRIFPFYLGDKARNWLRSLDTGTIRTWAQMSDVFLSKYFPPSKTSALHAQIIISGKEEESLSAKYGIDTKSCCVSARITVSKNDSFFRFSMKDLSNLLN